VLPKGKLKLKENAVAAARREVMEETGHRVSVREFLGAISYESRRTPKIVEFWRMESVGDARRREAVKDIKAVEWLPLDAAVARLSQPLERAFLAQVGPQMLERSRGASRRGKVGAGTENRSDGGAKRAVKGYAKLGRFRGNLQERRGRAEAKPHLKVPIGKEARSRDDGRPPAPSQSMPRNFIKRLLGRLKNLEPPAIVGAAGRAMGETPPTL
jgi:hypothetical protein